jgi:hypothetical protein
MFVAEIMRRGLAGSFGQSDLFRSPKKPNRPNKPDEQKGRGEGSAT